MKYIYCSCIGLTSETSIFKTAFKTITAPFCSYESKSIIYQRKQIVKNNSRDSLKDSFSKNHTYPYSVIGIIELNLAYHYPIVYWNTACLIVDAGADDELEENKSTDYGKIATAISRLQSHGENIALPLINLTEFGFMPDEENNRIIYSIKAINGIGDDVARLIIQNRPYNSMEDFYKRMIETKLVKTSQMIKLIKAGCFTELHSNDRAETMFDFLSKYVAKSASKLTLAQFERLISFHSKYGIIPSEVMESIAHKQFKDYILQDAFFYSYYVDNKRKMVKAGYHDRWFKLDSIAMKFFTKNYSEKSVMAVDDQYYVISEKKFIKENNTKLEPLRVWFDGEDAVRQYNDCLIRENWNLHAEGSVSKWEMDSLSIYCTQEHELSHVRNEDYGIVDFYKLPKDPEVYDTYIRYFEEDGVKVRKEFPKNKIVRIAGTVLDKNKDRHIVTILTTTGVVSVKFPKGQYAYYDRRLSEINDKGSKTVIDDSWFTRGNKIIVCGFRSDDQFIARKYTDTVWKHSCTLITKVYSDGSLDTILERGEE